MEQHQVMKEENDGEDYSDENDGPNFLDIDDLRRSRQSKTTSEI